ncbi:Fatty acid desaturase, putative [Penicillium digitatum]|uniref:Delta 8-(E)-sphingolipid desaturase n=3 Tax=Penicillium digitatum TaxID=36651 RepID=K9GXI1_PEND2|nr:Fatty acid desaturase, putative [Penicillium digitatum Pd1]EKV19313.1 Fatty acid desaturase, putative [Penicillium digitatum PHI26]EKV21270.1 Fatty acid desaturase, putative [Penicillium digitatum Pd1]QQK48084.1 Fatty acid desaturase, putative [Penicillium digitatum]
MAKTASRPSRKDTLLTRQYIEGLIAEGKHVIIFEGRVLRVDPFIRYHPGGEKPIKHMVGRDATDEINALHSEEARQLMRSYQIGRIEGIWINFLPPIQGGRFRAYNEDARSSDEDSTTPEICSGSSQDGSIPPSPIFDAVDSKSTVRQRKPTGTALTDQTQAKPAFLDARTREEIVFDTAKYPSLDTASQEEIKRKYRELNERIKAEGLYDCNYSCYFVECCRYTLFAGLSYTFLRMGWWATSAIFLGCFWHQLVFTAHDAGHMAITHNFHVDTLIGMFIADYLGGLSLGWWKRSHNVHHIVTNEPEHDPDIEHIPFFAISHRFLTSLRSTYYDRIMAFDALAQFLLKFQNYSYYPIMMLARFNLYVLSWEYLLKGQAPRRGIAWWHVWFELVGQVFFWTWFGYGVMYKTLPDASSRIIFLLVSHVVSSPLHVQITLSHFAMSTANLGAGESFAQKMLRTTMDVDCPTWLDFFHGGLQFQAIHHLYPRIPRHNLRRTQKFVIEFCRDTGIPYAIFTFYDGNKEVISRLGDVAKQVRLMEECRKSIAEGGVFSDHHH